jgi:hypothetical protein
MAQGKLGISFEAYGGANTPFAQVRTLRFSQDSAAGTEITQYIETLVGRAVFLARLDNLNNFGIYTFLSYTQSLSEPEFYDAQFSLQVSNGEMVADKNYGFGIYPELGANDKTFVYLEETPTAVWEITHNLGKYPSVSIVDENLNAVVADIEYIDTGSLRLLFSIPFAGQAFMN